MSKPVVKFKTYRQATRVGGKIYGVADLADPVVASVTMQEVIDYAKLHNYSAPTLEAMLSQVISGVADLVARDGRPRMLSDLLKFEPTIKGTFANLEQGITNQKIVVRPRMLKEIKLQIPADSFSWQNQNDTEAPKIISVAPVSDRFQTVDLASVRAGIQSATGFSWTLAGTRLAPNGWDAQTCSYQIVIKPAGAGLPDELHFEYKSATGGGYGIYTQPAQDEATDNTVALPFDAESSAQCWYMDGETPTAYDGSYLPVAGDEIVFRLTRTVGSGDTFTVEKAYTL